MFAVDENLGNSLKYLIDFEENSKSQLNSTSINMSDLDLTFTCSINPLLDLTSTNNSYYEYELITNGSNISINRSNYMEFIALYINYSLYYCCKELIDSYLKGIKILFSNNTNNSNNNSNIVNILTHTEIEILLCGSKVIDDLSLLRLNTIYRGEFNDEHPIVQWFWVSFLLKFIEYLFVFMIFTL